MSNSRRGLTACFVGAAACALYLGTLSNHFSGDSIEYALAIESADPALLLDPYHPLLHPLGLLFFRLWQLAGWTGRALLPLQVLNALAGGLCTGWWQELLEPPRQAAPGSWLSSIPDWHTGSGLVLELTSVTRPR